MLELSFAEPQTLPKLKFIRIADVQELTAAAFKTNIADMTSPSRKKNLALSRHVAMYLSRQFTKRSYRQIGQEFGDRNHTTVKHGVERITDLLGQDAELAARVRRLQHNLQARRDFATSKLLPVRL